MSYLQKQNLKRAQPQQGQQNQPQDPITQQPNQVPQQFQNNQNPQQQYQNNNIQQQQNVQQQQNQQQQNNGQQQYQQQQRQNGLQQTQQQFGYQQTTGDEQQRKQEILEFSSYFNAPKSHVRPTTDYFPKTSQLMRESRMTYGATIQPYGHCDIPLANFGQDPILRCDSCRTYINPFCKFIEQGYRWKCNMCGKSEATPTRYCQPLDENGYRVDINDRAELYSGSFDIKAGQDYCARPPMPPTYFFLIDVSAPAIESGALEMMLNTIKESIQNDTLTGGSRKQIGIITYDSHIHLYMLKPTMKQPQMIVLTDPKDTDLPVPDDLLVNVEESQDLILQLLESMPKMFQNNKQDGPTSFIFALEVALKIFKPVGGRLFIFQASNTLVQDKIFQPKHHQSGKNTQNQQQDKSANLVASSPHFRNLSQELHMAFITTSIFVFSNSFKNIVNLTELARYLNGEIYNYANSQQRLQQFYYDFKETLNKQIAWESVFRVRVSPGWRIVATNGNYSIKTSDLLSYLTDENKTVTYEFELEDTIARSDTFALQTALLYTNANGERRIRVHNYQLPLTNYIKEIYEYADASQLAMTYTKSVLYKVPQQPNIPVLKQRILQYSKDLIQIVMSFNKNNIPDSLMSFPLNILGVLKHRLFNSQHDAVLELDLLNCLRVNLVSMPIDEMMSHFVPFLFDIEDIHNNEDQTLCLYSEEGEFNFPGSVNPSFQSISNRGIFLMDAGNMFYLYVNPQQGDQSLLQDIFGTSELYNLSQPLTEDNLYHNSNNNINEKLYNLLNELRRGKSTKYSPLQIIVCGEKTVFEYEFYYKLIEDKYDGYRQGYNMDYNQFTQLII